MKSKSTISKLILSLFTIAAIFTACNKDDTTSNNPVVYVLPKLTVELDHIAGSSKFYLDSTYTNENGDQFTASMFKYYISNIRLVRTNNTEVAIPNTYFLVNQEIETSMSLVMDSLPLGLYKSIKFMIGIDSTQNVSGVQSGALDPANGMFWDLNNGYIFMKLEGTSPSIATTTHFFQYHIGGFKDAFINYKEVELTFNGDILTLNYNTHPELHMVVNILEIFKNPTTIDLSTFANSITTPNADAVILANNYADMIRYDHMHAE